MTSLLKRAQREGTPLIDGETATFVWAGDNPPQLIGDFTDWDWGESGPRTLTEAEPGVWTYSMTLPRDAYIEYVYVRGEDRQPDPFNKRRITNGMGKMNAYFAMPDCKHTDLVKRAPGVQAGTVTQHQIKGAITIANGSRPVYLYKPPTDEPVPLLFVLDGKDYFTRAKLPIIVDNLIAQKRIPPIALAAPQHGGRARFVEYLCSDATIGFLVLQVMKIAQKNLNLIDIEKNPGAYGILGASMGGLMALYAGLRAPEIFGRVISQSGAFGFDISGRETVIYDLVRNSPPRPINLWMDVGRYEWLITANRKMRDTLTKKGYTFTYREYNGGHNYTFWRDEVAHGLETVFAES